MLEIVDLFREKGTVDDLGYGIVRDALSDILFPGVSVLHTRPRYLLLVGWIYAGFLESGIAGQRAIDRGRRLELGLIQKLLDSGETQGVIGRVAGRKLKRLPSAAYWAALRSYGILRINSSLENYCRAIPQLRLGADSYEEGQSGRQQAWLLPPVPGNFPDSDMTLSLPAHEAHFLYERVMSAAGQSYLGWLLNQPVDDEAVHPWTHQSVHNAPERLRARLLIAEYYSLAQHGPTLLYNLLVARKAARVELVEDYESLLGEWAADMSDRFPATPFPTQNLWALVDQAGARITPATREFVNWTLTMSQSERTGLASSISAGQRIEHRELSLKKSLSRLQGSRSLDGWSGASGTGSLEYRWSTVQPMIKDIVQGKQGSHA